MKIGRLLPPLCLIVIGGALLIAQDKQRPPVVLTDEGRKVHFESFVFDGHNDLPWEMRTKADSSFDKRDIRQPQPKMHFHALDRKVRSSCHVDASRGSMNVAHSL